jgi:hypothetical protein
MFRDDEILIGKRVMFVHSDDPHTRLVYGDEGTVTNIDCMGTVFVKWDNGSSLGMVRNAGDSFLVIEEVG